MERALWLIYRHDNYTFYTRPKLIHLEDGELLDQRHLLAELKKLAYAEPIGRPQ